MGSQSSTGAGGGDVDLHRDFHTVSTSTPAVDRPAPTPLLLPVMLVMDDDPIALVSRTGFSYLVS